MLPNPIGVSLEEATEGCDGGTDDASTAGALEGEGGGATLVTSFAWQPADMAAATHNPPTSTCEQNTHRCSVSRR